jgi:polyhydroxybutyrate depolymerase
MAVFQELDLRKSGKLRNAFLVVASALLTTATIAQIQIQPLSHNGYDRPYLLYRPAHLSAHPAVVFMLGGITSTAESASREYGWINEADRNGFLAVFPEPVRTNLTLPPDEKRNITFWEMKGSRTHILGPGMSAVDDDGYLCAVLKDVLRREHPDPKRVFFAGFSSGSGMVQLFASQHPQLVSAVVAVATPLMDPPSKLSSPVSILYIHGDEDEQFTAFETNSPRFATTPHGNWVTWGYLNGCQKQTAEKRDWGVELTWLGCKQNIPVVAYFLKEIGHEWEGSLDWNANRRHHPPVDLNFTSLAWKFFSSIHPQ